MFLALYYVATLIVPMLTLSKKIFYVANDNYATGIVALGTEQDPFQSLQDAFDTIFALDLSSYSGLEIALSPTNSDDTVFLYDNNILAIYTVPLSFQLHSIQYMSTIKILDQIFTLNFMATTENSTFNVNNIEIDGSVPLQLFGDELNSQPGQVPVIFDLHNPIVSTIISFTEFKVSNLYIDGMACIIYGNNYAESVLFENVTVDNFFAVQGFYFTNIDSPVIPLKAVLNMTNCQFSNYNTKVIKETPGNRNRGKCTGYVISISGGLKGATLRNVTITKMLSQKIQTCDPNDHDIEIDLTKLDQKLLSFYSRFYKDHYDKPTSSAIFIDAIDFDFIVINSTFSQIAGKSGSAIVVNNLNPNNNKDSGGQVLIKQTYFKENFAFMGFPTVRLSQIISAGMFTTLEGNNIFGNTHRCLPVIFDNITVDGNTGCPTGYGVMWAACLSSPNFDKSYEPTDNPNRFETIIDYVNYNEYTDIIQNPSSSDINDTMNYIDNLKTNENKKFTLVNSTFINNRMSISSAIIIYGYQSIKVQNNTFQNNGVLFDSYITRYINSEAGFMGTWGYRPINQNAIEAWDIVLTTHTTPLLISFCMNLEVIDNKFIENWQIFQYELAFGSQLTLNGFILITENGFNVTGNSFINNTGSPPLDLLKYSKMFHNIEPVSAPLISMMSPDSMNFWVIPFVDHLNSTMDGNFSSISSTLIFLENIFIGNTFNFNYDDIAKSGLLLLNKILDSMNLYKDILTAWTGILQQFSYTEMQNLIMDDITANKYTTLFNQWISFEKCQFLGNKIQTDGCLVNSCGKNIKILDSEFHDNIIARNKGSRWDFTMFLNLPYFADIDDYQYGLICLSYNSFLTKRIDYNEPNYFANFTNITILNSEAVSINVDHDAHFSITINNSTFNQNLIQDYSLIVVHEGNNFAQVKNSVFYDNECYFGLFTFLNMDNLTFQTNVYDSNVGFWSSIYFLYSEPNIKETLTNKVLRIDNYLELDFTQAVNVQYSKDTKSNFTNNKNWFYSDHTTLSLDFSPYGGGLITQYGINLLLEECNFASNSPFAGIVLGYSSISQLKNSNIYGNFITGQGVLISLQYFFSIFLLDNVQIYNNSNSFISSNVFGAHLITNNGIIVLKNVTFSNNTFLLKNTIKLFNSKIFIVDSVIDTFNSINNHKLDIFLTSYQSLQQFQNVTFLNSVNSISLLRGGQIISTNVKLYGMTNISWSQLTPIVLFSLSGSDLIQFQNLTIYEDDSNTKISLNNKKIFEITFSSNIILSGINLTNIYLSQTMIDISSITDIQLDNLLLKNLKTKYNILSMVGATSVAIVQSESINLISELQEIMYVEEIQSFDIISFFADSSSNPILFAEDIDQIFINNMFLQNTFSAWDKNDWVLSQSNKCVDAMIQNYYSLEFLNNEVITFDNVSLADVCGGMYILDSAEVHILHSFFEKNKAEFGGALECICEFEDMMVTITNSKFIDNIAFESGGAIYFDSMLATEETCFVKIEGETIFEKNFAEIEGGAIYWNYFPIDIDYEVEFIENGFINNVNGYGPDIASYQVELVYFNPEEEKFIDYWDWNNHNNILLDNITIPVSSGYPVTQNIYLALVDVYGQLVSLLDNSQNGLTDLTSTWLIDENITIYNECIKMNNSLEILPSYLTMDQFYSPKIKVENGIYSIKNFVFDFFPGLTPKLAFEAKILRSLPPFYKNVLSPNQKKYIYLEYRKCVRGEILVELTCTVCPKGTYSINPYSNGTECFECPINAKCPGGDKIFPDPGYWRYDENATEVIECSNCIGGNSSIHGECDSNFTGILCGECQEDLLITQDGDCVSCDTDWTYHVKVVGFIILNIGIIAYGIKTEVFQLDKILEDSNDANQNSVIPNDLQNLTIDEDSVQSEVVRIFTSFSQVAGFIMQGEFTVVKFVSAFFSNLNTFSSVTKSTSMDCLYWKMFGKKIDIFYQKGLFLAFQPLIYLLTALIFWLIYTFVKMKKGQRKLYFKRRMNISITIILFNLIPSLMDAGFDFFKCVEVGYEGNSHSVLEGYYNIDCRSTVHIIWQFIFKKTK